MATEIWKMTIEPGQRERAFVPVLGTGDRPFVPVLGTGGQASCPTFYFGTEECALCLSFCPIFVSFGVIQFAVDDAAERGEARSAADDYYSTEKGGPFHVLEKGI